MMRTLAATLFVLASLLPGLAAAEAIQLPVETLDERLLDVPAELQKTPRVLVIGFTHASQKATKPWFDKLLPGCGAGLGCYNVSIIERMPGFARGFAVSKMRDDVPVAQHGQWLLVTENSAGWLQLAGTAKADDSAYIVVFGADGAVRARLHGQWSAALQAEVDKAVATP